MKHLREEDSFDGMANGVTEVEKVAETAFTFIVGYNVGFNTHGTEDDFSEELLDSFKSGAACVMLDTCICDLHENINEPTLDGLSLTASTITSAFCSSFKNSSSSQIAAVYRFVSLVA